MGRERDVAKGSCSGLECYGEHEMKLLYIVMLREVIEDL